jgi:hypothetical protein
VVNKGKGVSLYVVEVEVEVGMKASRNTWEWEIAWWINEHLGGSRVRRQAKNQNNS